MSRRSTQFLTRHCIASLMLILLLTMQLVSLSSCQSRANDTTTLMPSNQTATTLQPKPTTPTTTTIPTVTTTTRSAATSIPATSMEIPDFSGKTWLVIGDSISEHNFYASKNYDEYISEWTGCDVVNVAAAATGYLRGYLDNPPWLDRIDNFPEDVDFITVMGALNDQDYPLGNFGDQDRSTFYGGLHLFYEKLTEKYPDIPILVITSPPRAECYGEDGEFVGHINAVFDMAKAYDLPVFDLYRKSRLKPWNPEDNEQFFSNAEEPGGDGIHPNTEGQLILAEDIFPFMIENLTFETKAN